MSSRFLMGYDRSHQLRAGERDDFSWAVEINIDIIDPSLLFQKELAHCEGWWKIGLGLFLHEKLAESQKNSLKAALEDSGSLLLFEPLSEWLWHGDSAAYGGQDWWKPMTFDETCDKHMCFRVDFIRFHDTAKKTATNT